MTLKVDDFKSKLVGGGARANLFKVTMSGGPGELDELASFMCKAASIPGSSVAAIPVAFRGRQVQVAGDRTFENWSVTLYNQGDFKLRQQFEQWLNSLNGHESGLNTAGLNPGDYQIDMTVDQLDRQENVLATYTIKGAFPISVSAIELGFDANDAIEEFTVEFAYQYWTSAATS